MREAIKNVLEFWVDRLRSQEDHGWDNEDYDIFLPHHLLGAAKFMKDVAFEVNDLELLGAFTQIEMGLQERMRQQELEEIAEDEALDQMENDQEAIRLLCLKCFYKDSIFSVDMSKYLNMVEAVQDRFIDSYRLSSLIKYLDEDKVLSRIYEKVKSDLYVAYAAGGGMPNKDDVVKAFEARLSSVCKLADAHVASTIAKYAPVV